MGEAMDFQGRRKIDPSQAFSSTINLAPYIEKKGDRYYVCKKCGDVLIRVEPNGILGDSLNSIDAAVVLDHHLAKHSPK